MHSGKFLYNIILRGGAGRKTVLLIFQPTYFIVHFYDQYEKIRIKTKIIFCPRFVSMEMAAIFDFRALTKVHMTIKPLLQMQ